jgi:hypothetical protein
MDPKTTRILLYLGAGAGAIAFLFIYGSIAVEIWQLRRQARW